VKKETPVKIQLLTENDLTAAMRLVEPANWNQTQHDWRRLLRLEPQGCFAAWLDGRLVATITTTIYGTELAWIGMMFVARNTGIPPARHCHYVDGHCHGLLASQGSCYFETGRHHGWSASL
jgi:hypothetical protein